MNRPGEMDTGGRQWHSTPYQRNTTSGSVQGVYLAPGENVEWIWSADGTYIIGYNITGVPIVPKTQSVIQEP